MKNEVAARSSEVSASSFLSTAAAAAWVMAACTVDICFTATEAVAAFAKAFFSAGSTDDIAAAMAVTDGSLSPTAGGSEDKDVEDNETEAAAAAAVVEEEEVGF